MLLNMQPEMPGFADAVRRYCGSYRLVEHTRDGQRFRCRGALPRGYREVTDAHDYEGFLKPEFWSLPRISYGAME